MKNYTFILILLLATTSCASAEDTEDYSNDEIRTLLPFDAIPAITDPQFVSAGAAKLDDRQRCCGRDECRYHVVTAL